MDYVELIGYTASVFLVISFIVKKITHIRIINLIGCVFLVTYGVLKGLWPIIVPNLIISLVQIYYLFFNKKS